MDYDILVEGWMPETPMQKKNAALMIGRLNPPTAGHLEVIKKMIAFSRKNRLVPVIVIVHGTKSSQDKSKNPLNPEDRISYIQSALGAAAHDLVFIVGSQGGPAAMEDVRKTGLEPVAIAAGSDRASDYLKTLDTYFVNPDGSAIKHTIIPGLAERDPDSDADEGASKAKKTAAEKAIEKEAKKASMSYLLDTAKKENKKIPIELISGTLARHAVQVDDREGFAKVLGVKRSLADALFDKVKSAMNSASKG